MTKPTHGVIRSDALHKQFLPWLAEYVEALRDHPDALIEVSR